jgi:hypothetical protein
VTPRLNNGMVGVSPCPVLLFSAPKAFIVHNLTFHSLFTIVALHGGMFGAIRRHLRSFWPSQTSTPSSRSSAQSGVVWCGAWRDQERVFLLGSAVAALSMAFTPVRCFKNTWRRPRLFISLVYCRAERSIADANRTVYLAPVLTIAIIGLASNARDLAYRRVYAYRAAAPSIDQVSNFGTRTISLVFDPACVGEIIRSFGLDLRGKFTARFIRSEPLQCGLRHGGPLLRLDTECF